MRAQFCPKLLDPIGDAISIASGRALSRAGLWHRLQEFLEQRQCRADGRVADAIPVELSEVMLHDPRRAVADGRRDVDETDRVAILVGLRTGNAGDGSNNAGGAAGKPARGHGLGYRRTDRGMRLQQLWRDTDGGYFVLLGVDDEPAVQRLLAPSTRESRWANDPAVQDSTVATVMHLASASCMTISACSSSVRSNLISFWQPINAREPAIAPRGGTGCVWELQTTTLALDICHGDVQEKAILKAPPTMAKKASSRSCRPLSQSAR